MDKQDILVVLSLIITAIVIIFVALLAVAGSLQTLFNNIMVIALLMGDVARGIRNSLILSVVFSSLLGPPLSWGASLLGALNSDWWLKSYMSWYIAFKLGIMVGP